MVQSLAVSRSDKARLVERVATGVPLIPLKHTIEIPGKHAKLRISANDLEFYLRSVDGKAPDMALLRTTIQGDKRKMENMSTNLVGENKYNGDQVRLQIWDAAQGLYRFTVEQAIGPGEYALVQSNPEGEISLYIWDFGIDAAPGGEDNAAAGSTKPGKP
jgi:hypothetical protein